jgi:hypothetical protein
LLFYHFFVISAIQKFRMMKDLTDHRQPGFRNFAQRVLLPIMVSLIFVGALTPSSTYAQPYQKVLETDSTSWDVAMKELFGNFMATLYTVPTADTLYHELFLQGIYPLPMYSGKIREDAGSGKLWFVPPGETEDEYLIMDLSLNEGDTFYLPLGSVLTPIVAENIFYLEGRKYIEFDFSTYWDEPLRFIEGIGRNISMNNFWLGDFSYVACKYDSGEQVYVNSNPHFIGCELDPTGTGEIQKQKVILHYNPDTDQLTLQNPQSLLPGTQINIHHITGGMVYQARMDQFPEGLNLRFLPPGMYITSLRDRNGRVDQLKFIKH